MVPERPEEGIRFPGTCVADDLSLVLSSVSPSHLAWHPRPWNGTSRIWGRSFHLNYPNLDNPSQMWSELCFHGDSESIKLTFQINQGTLIKCSGRPQKKACTWEWRLLGEKKGFGWSGKGMRTRGVVIEVHRLCIGKCERAKRKANCMPEEVCIPLSAAKKPPTLWMECHVFNHRYLQLVSI